MTLISKLSDRFVELEAQMNAVWATKRYERSEYFSGDRIDAEMFLNWKVKARNLILKSCGSDSEHYKEFLKSEIPQSYRYNAEELQDLRAIFLASKEDYEGGYMVSVKSLVQAELFGSELDQARSLLDAGYKLAAAVVAGVVLETAIRQKCSELGIAVSKLDKMNADLAKVGFYNLLVQKRITALADIRNNAAHGNADQFSESDVIDMIAYSEKFLADYL